MARQNHYKREADAYNALILLRYQRNAAGLDGGTGAPLAITGSELADVKASAAEIVAKLQAKAVL